MRWRLAGDGREVDPGGADATVWLWELVSEDGTRRRSVRVKISGTAMVVRDVAWRLGQARKSRGQTEIARILDWDEPPDVVEFHSASRSPTLTGGDPGPEVRELAAIVDWFERRDIELLFGGHGVGAGPGPPPVQTWSATLLDLEVGELIARFEAPTRLAAARAARAWWREHRERPPTTAEIEPAVEQDIALPITPSGGEAEAPKIGPEQLARVRQLQTLYTLVWTRPDPRDPDSLWMIEALDKDGRLVSFAVQSTAEDALLTILEDLLPPDEQT
jgi:hypothetical protein